MPSHDDVVFSAEKEEALCLIVYWEYHKVEQSITFLEELDVLEVDSFFKEDFFLRWPDGSLRIESDGLVW